MTEFNKTAACSREQTHPLLKFQPQPDLVSAIRPSPAEHPTAINMDDSFLDELVRNEKS